MTHVLLFHHAQGLTDGVREFAGALRAAGHIVTLPDLYDGRIFATRDEGVAEAGRIGVAEIMERGRRAAWICRAASSTPASPWASCRRNCWPRPAPAHWAPCCSSPASRRVTSASRGPRACPPRST